MRTTALQQPPTRSADADIARLQPYQRWTGAMAGAALVLHLSAFSPITTPGTHLYRMVLIC